MADRRQAAWQDGTPARDGTQHPVDLGVVQLKPGSS